MNKSLLTLIVLSFFILSCGGDDDSCTAEMVLGTYIGTSECNDPTSEGPTSIVVTQSGSNLLLTDQDGLEFEVVFNGCENNIPRTSINVFGIDITYSGDIKFSDETIELDIILDLGVLGTTNCTFIGSRRM